MVNTIPEGRISPAGAEEFSRDELNLKRNRNI